MNKLCYNYKRDYYIAIIKNEQLLTTWMNHKRHDSNYKKVKNRQNSSQGTDVRTVVTSGTGEFWLKRYQGAFWGDRNVIYFYLIGGHQDIWMCKNSSGCTFKICVFAVRTFHLNKKLKIVSCKYQAQNKPKVTPWHFHYCFAFTSTQSSYTRDEGRKGKWKEPRKISWGPTGASA